MGEDENMRSNFSQQGEIYGDPSSTSIKSLNLVQVITFYKLKLKFLSTFCMQPIGGEGGPSWTC